MQVQVFKQKKIPKREFEFARFQFDDFRSILNQAGWRRYVTAEGFFGKVEIGKRKGVDGSLGGYWPLYDYF